MPKTDIEKLHESIGKAINRAKRQMFKRNREGMNPRDSYIDFMGAISVDIANQIFPPAGTKETDHVTLPDGQDAAEFQATRDEALNAQREVTYERVERWAKDAVQSGEQHQQLALVSLLDAIESADSITDMSGLALAAKYAAFQECESLHDEAIESVIVCGGMR